jgi:muramoyltetrapeptide carboxypeptidase
MKKIVTPPYLTKGSAIGLVCPAGAMPAEKAATCIQVLKAQGYNVVAGATLGSSHHYFSGTDEERLADLQIMLNDARIDAILCARGGYGTSRILDNIDWKAFRKRPKWIIGFSDITVLHSHLTQNLGIASLHAPMAAAFNHEEWRNPYVQSLLSALKGKKYKYTCQSHPVNVKGHATGKLVGGNLALLAHQVGSRTDVDTRGCILFIEDVGEYLYNIDRMLLQLDRAGRLSKLAALVVGGFADTKDTTTPFGKTVEEIVLNHVAKYKYPVCFNFPVSHEKENYALKCGMVHTLKVSKNTVLQETGI